MFCQLFLSLVENDQHFGSAFKIVAPLKEIRLKNLMLTPKEVVIHCVIFSPRSLKRILQF